MELEINAVDEVYAVWLNTDNTEGRGMSYIGHLCISETTALRLAKGKGVQGTDAPCLKQTIVEINGSWWAPVRLVHPTAEDAALDKENKKKAEIRKRIADAGISEEDIQLLLKKS